MYQVVISKASKAPQGLKSPVRAAEGLAGLVPNDGFEVILPVAIRFKESQLNEHGWFVDTDALEHTIAAWITHLSSDKWTNLFDFRPTFEQVAEASYKKLSEDVPQLSYVQ